MKFCLISDVHADLRKWSWSEFEDQIDSPTLVVAGDISNYIDDTCKWIADAKNHFKNVVWVAGNHDFYNSGFHQTRLIDPNSAQSRLLYPRTVDQIIDHYRQWSEKHSIHFLHRDSVLIDGVRFIGCTGWHDFIAGEPYTTEVQIQTWLSLNDKVILWADDQRCPDHMFPLKQAIADAEYLTDAVDASQEPTVIVTHHLPHRSLKWDRPEDPIWTKQHGGFVNTKMEKIINKNIKFWCYGHTHQRGMKDINGITYVCNSRGYWHENHNWQFISLEI